MTSASIVLFWSTIFPILKKKSRVSKRMQLLARTTRAASLAFLSQCFAGKSKPSITQELIFCLKHIIFNPLHRLFSVVNVLPYPCHWFGKRRWFPAHQIHQCLTQSFSPLDGSPAKVVGRCKRGSFPPEAHGWTNRCILCLAPSFSLFLILWPFLMLKAERLIERFNVHILIHFFAPSLTTYYTYTYAHIIWFNIWFITSISFCCLASSRFQPPSGLCPSSTAETEVWAERWRDFALLAGLEFARFHGIQPTTMKTPQP